MRPLSRVGISAYLLHHGADYRAAGVSTYTGQLLAHLPLVAPEHEYVAFHGRDAPQLQGARSVISSAPTQQPLVRIAWEQIVLPVSAARGRVDLLHGTVNVLPLAAPMPLVVTVHDLAFLRYPERFHRAKAAYLKAAVSLSVRRARVIIAVSEATKSDLMEVLGVTPDRISVVYSGADPMFRQLESDQREAFRRSHVGGKPYILHVGTLEPRKNLGTLIRAFAGLAERGYPHALVLVGSLGWMYDDLFREVSRLKIEQQVHFVDYVKPAELPLWYNCADLFALPSAHEGFGLPLLEAMACGLPAVTSEANALVELGGGACLTVEVGSEDALRDAMEKVLGDPTLRALMREAGLRRSAGFSWAETARATAHVYESVLQDGRS